MTTQGMAAPASPSGSRASHGAPADRHPAGLDPSRGPRVWNCRSPHLPPGAQYVGRGTPWGNPFVIGKHGNRDEVCDRFEREVLPTLDVSALIGRDLICWCAPKRCHADALLRKANVIAIEAGTVETEGLDAKHESACLEEASPNIGATDKGGR